MRMWQAYTLSLALALLAGLSLLAQQPQVRIELDTNLIAIGEQIKLKVTIDAPKQALIQWPDWQDTLVEKIEILNISKTDTSASAGLQTLEQELTLTGFDSGLYVVPPLVAYIDQLPYQSRPFLISVVTYEIDSIKGINDIKGIQASDFGLADIIALTWPITAGMLALGVTAAIVAWLRRKKKEVAPVSNKPKIPAHVLAIQRLEALQQQQLWQNGQVKEYHVSFSEIIREYIENQFGILALEQTTEEIIQQLRMSAIDTALKEELNRFLGLSDLVKFARMQPLPIENEQILQFAFRFVENTIPKEEPEEVVMDEGGEA